MPDTNAIAEVHNLIRRLDEPDPNMEEMIKTVKRGRPPKQKQEQQVSNTVSEYNFEPFKKMIQADKARLNQRRNELYMELEELNIKIAGLDYVEEKILCLMDNEK